MYYQEFKHICLIQSNMVINWPIFNLTFIVLAHYIFESSLKFVSAESVSIDFNVYFNKQ